MMGDVKRYIPEAEWHGPVYADVAGGNDGFFADVGEYREWLESSPDSPVTNVYPCTDARLSISARIVAENATDESPEGVQEDAQTEKAVAALQALLDAWVEKYVPSRIWEPVWNERVVMQGTEAPV